MLESTKKKFVRWIDPKMEKYRARKPAPKYKPETMADFIDVFRRTPKDILNDTDRAKIAAVMTFNEQKVKDLAHPKSEMVTVGAKELLGPLTIDRLYQSGFTKFPVINEKEHIVGILHTEAFNSLKIKETDQAEKYMNKTVSYLHESDSLEQMITEIHNTNSLYFIVLDDTNEPMGFVTIDDLLNYLLGR